VRARAQQAQQCRHRAERGAMPRVVVFGGSGKAGEYISCELVRSPLAIYEC
jgi:hypothetical protein